LTAFGDTSARSSKPSAQTARAVIEVVFADHLSRPSLDVRPGQLQIAADSWRSKSTAARAVAFFRPLAAWGHKRELMAKGFDDLEMPALAQDGEEIGQHILSRAEVGTLLYALGSHGHDSAARFMLLTAARREEIVGAVWANINVKLLKLFTESPIWRVQGPADSISAIIWRQRAAHPRRLTGRVGSFNDPRSNLCCPTRKAEGSPSADPSRRPEMLAAPLGTAKIPLPAGVARLRDRLGRGHAELALDQNRGV
jgi:hypothetical protein